MRIFVISRNKVIAITLAITAVICLLAFNGSAIESIMTAVAAKKDLPIYCVDRPDKTIAISFDAAWGIVISGHII